MTGGVAVTKKNEHGFALLMVLWAMALLSLLVTQVVKQGRAESKTARALIASAQLEAADDAAVYETVFHLLGGAHASWSPEEPDHVVREGERDVDVHIVDDRGKLDINYVPLELISSLLRILGSTRQDAATLGTAIYDWRGGQLSETTLPPPAPSAGYLPPHRAFERLEELLLVPGVTPALFARAAPHLVLHMDQGPLRRVADPVVEAALQQAAREQNMTEAEFDTDGPMVVGIIANARDGAASFTRRATLRITPGPDAGHAYYRVLVWEDGS